MKHDGIEKVALSECQKLLRQQRAEIVSDLHDLKVTFSNLARADRVGRIKIEKNLYCSICQEGCIDYCDCCKKPFRGGQSVHCIDNGDHICNKCFKAYKPTPKNLISVKTDQIKGDRK